MSTLDEYFTWTSALINGAQGLVNPILEEMGVPAPEGSAFEHAAREPLALLGLLPRWDTGDYPGGTLSSGHIIAECSGVGYSNVRPLPPLCATAAPPR